MIIFQWEISIIAPSNPKNFRLRRTVCGTDLIQYNQKIQNSAQTSENYFENEFTGKSLKVYSRGNFFENTQINISKNKNLSTQKNLSMRKI